MEIQAKDRVSHEVPLLQSSMAGLSSLHWWLTIALIMTVHCSVNTRYCWAESSVIAGGSSQPAEIEGLLSTDDFAKQQRLVGSLMNRVGLDEVQRLLYQSGLPFTGQTHLLFHTVGKLIYQRFGSEGMAHCRDYFLGACYHGVLISSIGEHGPQVVKEAFRYCREQGTPAMIECSHGAGHGLLAWTHYDLSKGLSLCDDLASAIPGFRVSNCYDGSFMENAWRLHQHDAAPVVRATSDPDYPCDDPGLSAKHLPACWGNQPAILFHLFRGDVAKVAARCDGLRDAASKEACYNGLARQIHPLTKGSSSEAFRLCGSVSASQWKAYCLATVAESSFAVGDRTRMPLEICAQMDGEAGKNQCYERLYASIRQFSENDPKGARALCDQIPNGHRKMDCLEAQGESRSGAVSESRDDSVSLATADSAQPPVTSYGTLDKTQYETPYQTPPYNAPYFTPYFTPYFSPYFTPYQTPYPTPYMFPYHPRY